MSFHPARAEVAPELEKADFRPALPCVILSGMTEMQMQKLTYREQLLHPNWQKRRLEALSAARFSCAICGDAESTLHVHHKHYVKGRMAWEYSDEELEVLCDACHQTRHANLDLIDRMFVEAGISGDPVSAAAALLGGFFAGYVDVSPEIEHAAEQVDGMTHDLGVLASIASCVEWRYLADAVDALHVKLLSPAQSAAYERWDSVRKSSRAPKE